MKYRVSLYNGINLMRLSFVGLGIVQNEKRNNVVDDSIKCLAIFYTK